MKPKVYIETSVISYLTSPPRREVVALGRQEVTRRWWETRRGSFSLVVSPVVLQEAQQGEAGYALALEAILNRSGVRPPLLCTPDQLLGDEP